MSVFPLLSLPFVSVKNCIECCDFDDIFNLSLTSEKCKKQIKLCNVRASEVKVVFGNPNNIVDVHYGKQHYTWNLIEIKNNEQNRVIRNRHDQRGKDYFYDQSINGLEKLYMEILDLLHKDAIDYVEFKRNIDESELFKYSSTLFDAKEVEIGMETISEKELDFIMETFRNIETFELSTALPRGYEKFREWKIKNLVFDHQNPTFFKLTDILSMEFEEFTVMYSKFKTSNLNLYIKNWLKLFSKTASNTPKYVTKFLIFYDCIKDSDIFNGLNTSPWKSKERGQYYIWPCDVFGPTKIDLSQGMDIIRDDGIMATIIIGDKLNVGIFVWHERFPKVPRKADCWNFSKTLVIG